MIQNQLGFQGGKLWSLFKKNNKVHMIDGYNRLKYDMIVDRRAGVPIKIANFTYQLLRLIVLFLIPTSR